MSFTNKEGHILSATLDFPLLPKPKAYAIFAHLFTGSKDFVASKHISRALTLQGIAVLRFDFTGLGESEGVFADTSFSTMVSDVHAAFDHLAEHYAAPQLIIGHSLGGAAALYAASEIKYVKAVATIGTPFQPEHVRHLFKQHLQLIESAGESEVMIGGRKFVIKDSFIKDICGRDTQEILPSLNKALLFLHSPQDKVVEIENAARLYTAAKHPKSFITLDGADHILSSKDDARYSGMVIGSWALRYLDKYITKPLKSAHQVVGRLREEDDYTTQIIADRHELLADEPISVGGSDFGPSPYELLSASLSACTAMTLQMYSRRKGWPLEEVKVHVNYSKDHYYDCERCGEEGSRLDTFERIIELEGPLDENQKKRIIEIAEKCPIHRTLESEVRYKTRLK
jgi:putative redox protein